jgi:hypothetical protein
MLLFLQEAEVLQGIEDPTAEPSRQFYSNTIASY